MSATFTSAAIYFLVSNEIRTQHTLERMLQQQTSISTERCCEHFILHPAHLDVEKKYALWNSSTIQLNKFKEYTPKKKLHHFMRKIFITVKKGEK